MCVCVCLLYEGICAYPNLQVDLLKLEAWGGPTWQPSSQLGFRINSPDGQQLGTLASNLNKEHASTALLGTCPNPRTIRKFGVTTIGGLLDWWTVPKRRQDRNTKNNWSGGVETKPLQLQNNHFVLRPFMLGSHSGRVVARGNGFSHVLSLRPCLGLPSTSSHQAINPRKRRSQVW